MNISRRHFLETAALGGLGVNALTAAEVDKKTGMQTRILGRTGARVSVLAFGAGSRFLAYKDENKALEVLNKAIDMGINYVDTANSYGNGQSETWVGKLMKTRRKDVWLTTKLSVRKADDAMKAVDATLKRLQTDKIDLIHIHSLTRADDLAAIEAPDGVLKALYKLRDQKVCRAIGVTSHTDPNVLKTALERHDFDCTQMALNAAKVGNVFGKAAEGITGSFEEIALPVAVRKNMGIIAMKVFAQERLVGKAAPAKLIAYALSLPISACVVGMPQWEHVEENIRAAKEFKPLPRGEMDRLNQQMLPLKASIDRFFANHMDC